MTAAESLAERIRDYYLTHLDTLTLAQQFHFLNRLWLWGADQPAGVLLRERENIFIPRDEAALHQRLQQAFVDRHARTLRYQALRASALNLYPQLLGYNNLMFQALYAQTVFGRDIKDAMLRVIPQAELLTYRAALQHDQKSILLLSTHAVNYFHLTHTLFGGEEHTVNPAFYRTLAEITPGAESLHRSFTIYLVTHAILGESRFYARPVTHHQSGYQQLVRRVEGELAAELSAYSLDTKFEFLVCATLVGQPTSLRTVIIEEALTSQAPDVPYLVDTHNRLSQGPDATNRTPAHSEHRNILFIMAMTPYADRAAVSSLPQRA